MTLPALPALGAAGLPADVRRGSAEDRRSYEAALGFERLLVAQLVDAAMPEAEDAAPRADAVPDAFADALIEAGGLGLARQLHEQLRRERG